jgi:hypothetical protein
MDLLKISLVSPHIVVVDATVIDPKTPGKRNNFQLFRRKTGEQEPAKFVFRKNGDLCATYY